MCEIGACAASEEECPLFNGCTNDYPVKCDKSGTCSKTTDDCENIFKFTKLPNGCTY